MVSPLKIGLIGAGRIANRHLAAYLKYPERAKLVAVCDIVSDAAQACAKKTGVKQVYTDPLKMIKEANIEAVDICASHDMNAFLTISAAENGKHVLVEKPMGISVQQCNNVLKTTNKAGITFMVAQMLRYVPNNRVVHNLIKDNVLGKIRAVHSEAMANGISLMKSGSWYSDKNRSGGGVIFSVAIHNIDLLRYFFGNVKSVFASFNTSNLDFPPDIEDHASVILRFENGVIADLFADFATRRVPWVWQYLILGSEGTLISHLPFREQFGQQRWDTKIAHTKMEKQKTNPDGSAEEFQPLNIESEKGLDSVDPFINEILHFAQCCQLRQEPISSGLDNYETIKTVQAIYESAATGKVIDLLNL